MLYDYHIGKHTAETSFVNSVQTWDQSLND